MPKKNSVPLRHPRELGNIVYSNFIKNNIKKGINVIILSFFALNFIKFALQYEKKVDFCSHGISVDLDIVFE